MDQCPSIMSARCYAITIEATPADGETGKSVIALNEIAKTYHAHFSLYSSRAIVEKDEWSDSIKGYVWLV